MSLLTPSEKPREAVSTTLSIVGAAGPNGGSVGVGESIGPYRLMEKIGEGGFGLVFVAEQQVPVKRTVALKLLKPGMDSREIIARFEAERQALALMDHPNIARVFDAGATPLGRPYFVMELVRGKPITDYCDQHRLTLPERLELFVKVCQAIQHAHQKGIIHRDIKPSNVLVTLHDGVPVVKVIDFGVAKALHQHLTEKTIYTHLAQVIGTPLYMSPEQAEMSGLDIDTRSDIYSLGVLLYELLTGTTPFDGKRLAKVAFDERIRIIRDEEPPKPSTRLRHTSDTLPSIAAQRMLEPGKLSKIFRGDLDRITMKALEKERTRRYETASALAADVVRYLRNEPVEASPPSTLYLLGKFARRYRTILATAAAFVVLLLTGVVVATVLWIRASQDRDFAERSLIKADQARESAEAESRRADQNAESARSEAAHARRAQTAAEQAGRGEAAERKVALAALERSERSRYFSSIALAERNWEAKNPKRAGDILDDCPQKFRDWEWRYMHRLVHAEAMTLRGDTATYSPDGELLATSGDGQDGSIAIRDARSGKIVLRLAGGRPVSHVQSVVFSPDSRRVAAICVDGALRVWNLPTGRQTLLIPVRLSRETVGDSLHHPVTLQFSPDGGRIALAGVASDQPNEAHFVTDNLVVWDASSGNQVLKISDTGTSFAFSPDGKKLATSAMIFIKDPVADWQGPITDGMRILDAVKGGVLVRFPAWRPRGTGSTHRECGADDCNITYSPDGKWLASARKGEITIWDAATAAEVRTLRGHEMRVTALAFSPDSKSLASASRDETVRIWNLQAGGVVVYRGHAGEVTAVTYRPDGKFIASTGRDQTVRIWSAAAKQGPRQTSISDIIYGSICFCPGFRSVACLRVLPERRYQLVLVDASTGKLVRSLRFYTPLLSPIFASLVFSHDGRLLASALEKEIQVWDVASGRELASFSGDADYYQRGLAFSAEGGRIALTGPRNSVEVWRLADRKRLAIFSGHRGPVTTIALSSHGDRAASASLDGTVRIWDPSSGKELRDLPGTQELSAGLAFSPDGRCLLASSSDHCVRVWDLGQGTERPLLQGHRALVTSIAFNPAGTRVATIGQDSTTRLWTWPECQEILSLPVPPGSAIALSFVAEGQKLAAAWDKGVIVWDAAPATALTPSDE